MNKIAIAGCGGAGKSTLAYKLRAILNVDVVHVDSIFWKPGWIPTAESERRRRLKNILQRSHWIVEGDGDRSSRELIYDLRFASADAIVFLDFPRTLCIRRVLKRYLDYQGKSRPDLPPGCREYIKSKGFLESLKRIWNYPKEERQLVLQKIRDYCAGKRVIILRSPSEVEEFLRVIGRVEAISKSTVRYQKLSPENAIRKQAKSYLVNT